MRPKLQRSFRDVHCYRIRFADGETRYHTSVDAGMSGRQTWAGEIAWWNGQEWVLLEGL